jgi:hypothetical protein
LSSQETDTHHRRPLRDPLWGISSILTFSPPPFYRKRIPLEVLSLSLGTFPILPFPPRLSN